MADPEAHYCFEFEYHLDDIVGGIMAARSMRGILLSFIVIAVVCGFQFMSSTATMLARMTTTLCPAVAALLLFILYVRYYHPRISARRMLRSNSNLRGRQQWTVSQSGVKIVSAHGSSDTQWRGLGKIRENENIVLLYLAGNIVIVLPKRAIPEDIKEPVLVLIRENISER